MTRIKPFCALKPSPVLQNRVVTRPLEHYSIGQAKLIVSENPHNFLHLISPDLTHQYLRGSRQELIYKKIEENFSSFIEKEVLVTDSQPAIYIYQVQQEEETQIGIWTLTHIDDYLKGKIKKHELTVERREKLLADYLQQTALDANPVLITYPPVAKVDEIIAKYTKQNCAIDFEFSDGTIHKIWAINNVEDIELIVNEFADLPAVYIADGHHRVAAMAQMAINKRQVLKKDAEANFNYFSSAYFSTKQIKVLEFNRLVKDLNGFTSESFVNHLAQHFIVEKVDAQVKPSKMHEFGMYVAHQWYKLTAKANVYAEGNAISVLDVTILQDYILEEILGIKDPRTDARITFEGGKTAIAELQKQVDHENYAVAFTLFPTLIEQIIAVADINGVMPPKSTWVEPKFLVGMLTNHIGK